MKSMTSLALDSIRQGVDPGTLAVRLALRKALSDCRSVLDVGCGFSPLMRNIGVPHIVGIDGYAPSIEQAKKLNTHDEMVHGDVRKLDDYFRPKQFDACVGMDVIEHVIKSDGIKMMQDMENIAAKKVVIFTPCGFLRQRHASNDDLQEHLSGWEPSEMADRGYQVLGFLGPKKMRGEYHAIKGRPRVFWSLLSLMGHFLWTRNHPDQAAAILCVKNLVAK